MAEIALYIRNWAEWYEMNANGRAWKADANKPQKFRVAPLVYCRTPTGRAWERCWEKLLMDIGMEQKMAAKGFYHGLLEIAMERHENPTAVVSSKRGWILGFDNAVLGAYGVARELGIGVKQAGFLLLSMVDAGLLVRRECKFAKKGEGVCELGRNVKIGKLSEISEISVPLKSESEAKGNVNINKQTERVDDPEPEGQDELSPINKDAGCASGVNKESQGLTGQFPEESHIAESQIAGSQEESQDRGIAESQNRSGKLTSQGAKGPLSGQAGCKDPTALQAGMLANDLLRDDPVIILNGLSDNESAAELMVVDRAEQWTTELFPETLRVARGETNYHVGEQRRQQAVGDITAISNAIAWCWRQDKSGKEVVELVRITQAFCVRAAKPRNTMDNPMKVLMSEYKKHLGWPGNVSVEDSRVADSRK